MSHFETFAVGAETTKVERLRRLYGLSPRATGRVSRTSVLNTTASNSQKSSCMKQPISARKNSSSSASYSLLLSLLVLANVCVSAFAQPSTVRVSSAASATQTSPTLVELVLDTGERSYPAYFPGHKATLTSAPFRFRYYSETGIYLGVATSSAGGYLMNGVYVMGGAFGTSPVYVGLVTDFVSLCQERQADPLSGALLTCYDLDGDGVVETAITYTGNTIAIRGAVVRDVALDVPASFTLRQIVAIGNHVGSALSEIALRFDDPSTTGGYMTTLLVVDPDVAAVVARTTQPFRAENPVTTGYPLMADGRRIPVMVPGLTQVAKAWEYLCKFDLSSTSSVCGVGFSQVSVAPPPRYTGFWNNGAPWFQDVTGDGYDDVHVKYYRALEGRRQDGGILTISLVDNVRSWTTLNMGDMARDADALFGAQTGPGWDTLSALSDGTFDLGRLYGTASAFRAGGRDKVLLVGGNPIGAFPNSTTDVAQAPLVMCNVTRYVGLLDSTPGALDSRRLQWGWYFGFYQNVIENRVNILLGDGALLKPGYLAHGCVHRYDDSRVSVEEKRAVAFSVFRLDALANQRTCETEQRAYFRSRTDAADTVFRACVIGTSSSAGRWAVQVLDETTGASFLAVADTYLWGFSTEILPGGQTVFLVERFERSIPFNRSGVPDPQIRVLQLNSQPNWKVTDIGLLPAAGAPVVRERGYGSTPPPFAHHKSGNLSRLSTRPNALAKGLVDFQMATGAWVGYSPSLGRLVLK
jgi:hypothetical protein